MALLVTGQGSWDVKFLKNTMVLPSGSYEGRIDYVIRTDDTTCLSTLEYKFYLKGLTAEACSQAERISSVYLSTTYYKTATSMFDTNDTYGTIEQNISIPSLSVNTLTLVHSGSYSGVKLHNTSTGLPFHNIEINLRAFFTYAYPTTGVQTDSVTMAALGADEGGSYTVITAAIAPTTISSSSGFLGEPITINLAHKRTGVYGNITYKLGNTTGYLANGVTAASFNWTIPDELIVEFGEDEIQKEMTLYCNSFLDGIHLGETQAKLTVFLPSGQLVPVMNPTVKDINPDTVALTGNENCFVRYKSIAEYAINAAAVKGAKLVKQQVKNGTYIVDNIPSGTIPNVETGTFEFLAIDNRDMGTSTSIFTSNFVEYIKLTCNQKIHMEVSGETGAVAIVNIFGNYYKGSFGAQDNTLKIEIKHTNNDGTMTDWVDISSFSDVRTSNGTYEVDFSISGLRYDVTYTFQCRVTDKLETAITKEYVLKVMPVFDWSEDDFNFNVPVAIDGDITMTKDRTIQMGDCSIENNGEEININARTINLNAPNVAFNSVDLMNIDNGTWTPTFATSEAIASYSTREGWYQKIGNTVTIGFNITAICKSGYTGTSLVIQGVPFTPIYSAFGGGVASRTHVAANNNFQCWAINTSGEISGRVQLCNQTTNGSLTTSATGLYYGAQDIAITVGGTITYITND